MKREEKIEIGTDIKERVALHISPKRYFLNCAAPIVVLR